VYVNGLLLREQALQPPKPLAAYNFALGPMSVAKNMGTIRLANVRMWKRALPLGELQHSMAVRDFSALPQVGGRPSPAPPCAPVAPPLPAEACCAWPAHCPRSSASSSRQAAPEGGAAARHTGSCGAPALCKRSSALPWRAWHLRACAAPHPCEQRAGRAPQGLIMNMHCDDCGTKGEGNEIDLPVPRWHLLKVGAAGAGGYLRAAPLLAAEAWLLAGGGDAHALCTAIPDTRSPASALIRPSAAMLPTTPLHHHHASSAPTTIRCSP
jgi:hypothetical protein